MGLFGKTPEKPPKEMVREWTSKLRKEGYVLDRQIKAIQREEDKVKRSLKDAAKKGQKDVCSILAKEIVRARKQISRIHASKAHLNSVSMQMKNQEALVRLCGALEKSTQVMQSMQALVKVPQIQATMMELSKEMMKAGIMEEMLDDTMEMLDDDEMEDEASEEVEKVLFELTAGDLGKAPSAVTDTLPEPVLEGAVGGDEEEEEDASGMQARLEALRS